MSIAVDSRYLQVLFEEHGIASVVVNGWVLPEGRRPAIRADWYQNGNGLTGVFSVLILMPDGLRIEEACAGLGAGEEGIKDGFAKFMNNSFHVLLAALWQRDASERVVTKTVTTRSGRYTGYFGPTCGYGTPHFPADLSERIERCLEEASLTDELHWMRFFVSNYQKAFTFEALNNGEPWEHGLRALQACPWTPDERYYVVRVFLMLRRADEPALA
ncbi:DUF6348 family protein [Massilia rubra]|uniref:Uncharacterized protein n=1 Tax=Massilia rubra TaxID=2607910 RepID=A0ABX0LSU3_9BURK|nr:DUF6348 family protein [Massilia rubra]NHZ37918.1 hypothetical protein [Massilia rubra]